MAEQVIEDIPELQYGACIDFLRFKDSLFDPAHHIATGRFQLRFMTLISQNPLSLSGGRLPEMFDNDHNLYLLVQIDYPRSERLGEAMAMAVGIRQFVEFQFGGTDLRIEPDGKIEGENPDFRHPERATFNMLFDFGKSSQPLEESIHELV